MKTVRIKNMLIVCFVAISGIYMNGCTSNGVDMRVPPTIDFTTTAGYTSMDSHIALNTNFLIGIDAKRTEGLDNLKTFIVTRSYDAATATTIDNVTIPTAQGAEFMKDYPLTTRNQAGTEKYTFTVTNRDGLITTKSITITVP